ncbi:MAG: hypothetical protein FJX77_12495, partial [Armatimonadetes bacterium]|nr:hypothetical protein [Armatimonadota bacterium]
MTFITNPRVGQLLDRATRGILTYPRILRETVRVFEPALEACFDFERSVLLPREFTLFDWRIREGDLPLLTPFRADPTAAWINVLVWIEHQTQSHSFMPLRSLVYGTLHWEVAWKEWEQLPTPKPALRVSALFPIVLYFGGSRWTSSRNLREV